MSDELKKRIRELESECETLKRENAKLHSSLPADNQPVAHDEVPSHATPEQKITLFKELFHGREDVYPVRWENQQGKAGYSPVYDRSAGLVPKEDRKYLPLTDDVIRAHLMGEVTAGVYPLLLDDTCWFLAADFDKKTWKDDCLSFLESCDELSIPASLECSRSGNGGHVWIFFDAPIRANLARCLGSLILTHAMESRPELGLDSYDRFFPSQDTLPKGGFGNLIALPLQKHPRQHGRSVFLDRDLRPYKDQWAYLSSIKKVSNRQAEVIVDKAESMGDLFGIRRKLELSEGNEAPWELKPSENFCTDPIAGELPDAIRVIRSNLLYIEKAGLPSALVNRIIRLAAFHNPEFYRAQAMRFSTFGKPRLIHCAEEISKYIALPRGDYQDLKTLCHAHHIEVHVEDKRFEGVALNTSFLGELRKDQKKTVRAIMKHDEGVICAATAFGKTVVAASLIARRKVNTLIIVHRRQLLDQWRERLLAFLEMEAKEIGQVGGGKNKPTGIIDIAIMQSLNRKGTVKDLVADYGHVIIDECHHVSAFSFERVMRQVKARYITGLTATPERKDGHHPIIFMQCGPIRFRMTPKAQAKLRPFCYRVYPVFTQMSFNLSDESASIQELYRQIMTNEDRNVRITHDVAAAFQEGRNSLVLTERVEHIKILVERLCSHAEHIIILKGGMGSRQRKEAIQRLESIPEKDPRIIIATGKYIGEGFDYARLDTLFLAMPISWKGTLQQYAGRLHRMYEGKEEVRIYDYVDDQSPMLAAMFKRRLKGYAHMGYEMYDNKQPEFDLSSRKQ